MAIIDRLTLKRWFARGMRPLEVQFAAWLDSYWHKQDAIPLDAIEQLPELRDKLNDVASIAESALQPDSISDVFRSNVTIDDNDNWVVGGEEKGSSKGDVYFPKFSAGKIDFLKISGADAPSFVSYELPFATQQEHIDLAAKVDDIEAAAPTSIPIDVIEDIANK